MTEDREESNYSTFWHSQAEESLVSDDRACTRPAQRVEQKVFDQLSRVSLGVSAYRLHACQRGRVLS